MKFYSFWRSLASFRVRIALNIKGIVPDEVVNIDLMKGDQRQDAYKKINPQMLLPALIDGDGPILFQSVAIMEYLDETHPDPPMLPKDPRGRARVRALALINAADSHPLMVPRVRNFMEHELKLDEATREKWIKHWIGEGLAAMEGHLARDKETGKFAHGESVTMADICVAAQVTGAGFFKVDTSPYPTVKRIADALHGARAVRQGASAEAARRAGEPWVTERMLNAAMIGLGWWGKELVRSARDSQLMRFTRGVTLEPDTVRDFATRDEASASARPTRTCWPTNRSTAVVLATPHTRHRAQVEAAAAAGKHVFCEKPFALTVDGREGRDRGVPQGRRRARRRA